jgi:hypothetical protein
MKSVDRPHWDVYPLNTNRHHRIIWVKSFTPYGFIDGKLDVSISLKLVICPHRVILKGRSRLSKYSCVAAEVIFGEMFKSHSWTLIANRVEHTRNVPQQWCWQHRSESQHAGLQRQSNWLFIKETDRVMMKSIEIVGQHIGRDLYPWGVEFLSNVYQIYIGELIQPHAWADNIICIYFPQT